MWSDVILKEVIMFQPSECVIEEVIYDKKDPRNGRIELRTTDGCWSGMERKNMWRRKGEDETWDKYLVKGNKVKMWLIQGSRVVGLQIWVDGNWADAWCATNDFGTFEEDEKRNKTYDDFCIKEGKLVKQLIEQEKTLKQIDKAMDDGHSGYTYSWAMGYGIANAKNKEYAKKIRSEWNKENGGTGEEEGTINTAILTIETK
jgi:hypothetical protein